jgi:hypothetical protein
MIDSENFYLVQQIASLLEKKLDLKVKDHGMWRIQCLIWDTLEEKENYEKYGSIAFTTDLDDMSEEQKKELTTN